jgi:hypothetical protein
MEDAKRMISGLVFVSLLGVGLFWYFGRPVEVDNDLDYYREKIVKLEEMNSELKDVITSQNDKIEALEKRVKELEDKKWWRPGGEGSVEKQL